MHYGKVKFQLLLFQDRQTILFAVRLIGHRVYFDYFSRADGERHSVGFKDFLLADDNWHTLVVTVTGKHIKFTIDCQKPQQT